jgi:hypothetical protein
LENKIFANNIWRIRKVSVLLQPRKEGREVGEEKKIGEYVHSFDILRG